MNQYNPFNFLIVNELVDVYCKFCESEYDEVFTEKEKEELRNKDVFHIACTDIEEIYDDEEIVLDRPFELQCDYYVSDEKYVYTLDGKIILEQKESVEDVIYELQNVEFEDFIRDGLYIANQILSNLHETK